jgi:TonB family protein
MKAQSARVIMFAFAAFALISSIGKAFTPAQETPSSLLPEAQIHEVTSRIIQSAEKANCKPGKCKILVTDFAVPSGFTSQFGLQLADQFSKELASRQNGIQIIDRSILKTYLDKERISSDLLSNDRAMRWLGNELNATAVLTGITKSQESFVNVRLKLLSCNKDKGVPIEEFTVPLPDSKNALSGFDRTASAASNDKWSSVPAAYATGPGGATIPICQYCPHPPYSEVARAARFEGQVVLEAVVSEDGTVKWTRIIRGAPFGLNQEALNAVRQWKFKPGLHDGKPVSVLLPLDLGFRLLN